MRAFAAGTSTGQCLCRVGTHQFHERQESAEQTRPAPKSNTCQKNQTRPGRWLRTQKKVEVAYARADEAGEKAHQEVTGYTAQGAPEKAEYENLRKKSSDDLIPLGTEAAQIPVSRRRLTTANMAVL